MLAAGLAAALVSGLSAAGAAVHCSVVGGLLSAIAAGWTIEAAVAGTTFIPAAAFGVIGLLFTALGRVVWRALDENER